MLMCSETGEYFDEPIFSRQLVGFCELPTGDVLIRFNCNHKILLMQNSDKIYLFDGISQIDSFGDVETFLTASGTLYVYPNGDQIEVLGDEICAIRRGSVCEVELSEANTAGAAKWGI